MNIMKSSAWLLVALLAGSTAALAHGPGESGREESGQEEVSQLQNIRLPDAPGRNGVMVTVSYKPGQVSIPHVHSGSVFAYVLEGEVTSQLQGEAPVTYKAGQSWYEKPGTPHLVSRNASQDKPAKLLVWLLLEQGRDVLEPLSKSPN